MVTVGFKDCQGYVRAGLSQIEWPVLVWNMDMFDRLLDMSICSADMFGCLVDMSPFYWT